MLTTQNAKEKAKELKSVEDVQKFLKDLGNSLMSELSAKETGSVATDETVKPAIKVRKYESVEGDPFFEDVIISLYAKGLSTRAIENHLLEAYGIEISTSKISEITDKILPQMRDWEQRPLSSFYPFVYLDGIHFKVRDSGKMAKRCGYTVLGINDEGAKEVLGVWIGETEGAKFWLHVLNELKTRGVEDILICCVDGLKGFSEAINAVYPNTHVQQCIVHQVRHTTKFVAHSQRREFCADQRTIYKSVNAEAGWQALQSVKEKWPKYADLFKSWEDNWDELSIFFSYGPAIRKMIYTTNPIENLHRQFRRVNKTKDGVYPSEESLKKSLWLAQRDIAKRWTMPTSGWGEMLLQLAIIFPGRVVL